MRKFIHSDFEVDLSVYGITDTAENPWFTGTYFAKYSFPFTMELTSDVDLAIGHISHYQSADAQTIFEGTYVNGDVMEKAVLEVEECEKGLSVTLRYGLDDFPNFSKKLAELPLIEVPVENIYTHAALTISQTWPAVNYNFPQIHIDKINPEDDAVWFAFEKIINNYKNGAFLINEVDLVEEITYNRNIMQPLPYLLYLLQAGFAEQNFILKGDVLANANIQKTLVYTDTDYYTSIAQESIDVLALATDYDSSGTVSDYSGSYTTITLSRTVEILHPGKYRVTGTAQFRYLGLTYIDIKIKYRNTIIAQWNKFGFGTVVPYYWEADVIFETLVDDAANFVTIEAYVGYNENDTTLDFNINPVRLHDDSGEAVASILNLNEVNLKKAVPDMTFGDLVKDVLSRYNMDLTPKGNEMWMNYVSTEIATRPVKDLSGYEVKFPKRKFSKGNSFLLKYEDVTSDDYDYSWAQVYQNKDGFSTTDFTTDEKTTEVTFKSLPLPLLMRNEIQTAHGFLQEITKPLYVMYNGLQNGKNLSLDPAALQVPQLHINFHQVWLASRINSKSYTWTFMAYAEKLQGLTSKSRVHAYGNIHLVKNLQQTEVRPDLYEVEVETEVF